uniref:SAM domain-containing protein n=1 Tax=Lotharella globosa TaxID=91324 RepID=A0A7S3ZB35_9EUKA|mmetsp:Transcript_8625/g.16700  ORF Transcript_8625/g.16700 Transcript_8625/m.16700 type:complete len:858 (-) Transcript_8625:86-2659(-)
MLELVILPLLVAGTWTFEKDFTLPDQYHGKDVKIYGNYDNGYGHVALEVDSTRSGVGFTRPTHRWTNQEVSEFFIHSGIRNFSASTIEKFASLNGLQLLSLTVEDMEDIFGVSDKDLQKLLFEVIGQLEKVSFMFHYEPQSFYDTNKIILPVGTTKSHAMLSDVEDDLVHICIISDRVPGLLGTLGSIALNTKKPEKVVVWLVTDGEETRRHIEADNLFEQISKMTIHYLQIEDLSHDLLEKGINPVWKWDVFGSSLDNADWKTKYTVRTASWDASEIHYDPLNHLRFYLPFLPQFNDKPRLLFLDDDLIIQGDIHHAWTRPMSPRRVLTGVCGMWVFDDEMKMFTYPGGLKNLSSSPSVVLTGRTVEETACPPKHPSLSCVDPELWPLLRNLSYEINGEPLNLQGSHEWNFGFTIINMDAWRRQNITSRYEKWMRANYLYHIFPENSLTYGLGLPFLALDRLTGCWELDSDITVRDGLGYVTYDEFKFSGVNQNDLRSSFALHYDGGDKPWKDTADPILARPYRLTLEGFRSSDFPVGLLEMPKKPQGIIFVTEPNTGGNWLLKGLDNHPNICAHGESYNPRFAFPMLALMPYEWGNKTSNECNPKAGCTFGFVLKWMKIIRNRPELCNPGTQWDEGMRFHSERLCNMYNRLPKGEVTKRRVHEVFMDSVLELNPHVIPCRCPPATEAVIMNQLTDWIRFKPGVEEIDFYEDIKARGAKVILFHRSNRIRQYVQGVLKRVRRSPDSTDMVKLDVPAAVDSIQASFSRVIWIKHKMEKYEIPVHPISFETCISDVKMCLRSIERFTGVEHSDTVLEKIGKPPVMEHRPREIIQNYLDLELALRMKGLERYIEEEDKI